MLHLLADAGVGDKVNIISVVMAACSVAGVIVVFIKAPWERDVAKRGITVEESAEIRQTLTDTLDQVQEERDGARREARTLRSEVEQCRGDCDSVRSENASLRAENDDLKRRLRAAELRVEQLENTVRDLQRRLES